MSHNTKTDPEIRKAIDEWCQEMGEMKKQWQKQPFFTIDNDKDTLHPVYESQEQPVDPINVKTAESWYMNQLETAIQLIKDALPYSASGAGWHTRAIEFLDKHI